MIGYSPGSGVAPGFRDPSKALGAPVGAGRTSGSLDVVSLGLSGSLTLGFDRPLTDGPGADFIVFENAFYVGLGAACYAEVAFVEVSSNGVDFARFETSYVGPQQSIGAYGALPCGSWRGLAGTTPTLANPTLHPEIDVRDPARAGGDPFDLASLRDHPLVKLGRINLAYITHVRIVDVEDGKERDSFGRLIRDPSAGSCDIDAVSGIHFLGQAWTNDPTVLVSLDAARRLRIEIGDPQGLGDLDLRRLHTSLQGDPVDTWGLLTACRVVRADPKSIVFESAAQLPKDLALVLSLSAQDHAGHLSGSTVHLH
ncbi:MAG: hypothetical protein KDC95_23130 [Planctomycetes bacterium]|nr:hypothetical protein [Planctomycetota bacterium]